MKLLKQSITVTLDEDIITRVKAIAEEDDRSFSQYVNLILRDYLKELDNK